MTKRAPTKPNFPNPPPSDPALVIRYKAIHGGNSVPARPGYIRIRACSICGEPSGATRTPAAGRAGRASTAASLLDGLLLETERPAPG